MILRRAIGEGFFRQMKQDFEAVVSPTARNFVKHDGKRRGACRSHEYLEAPKDQSSFQCRSMAISRSRTDS